VHLDGNEEAILGSEHTAAGYNGDQMSNVVITAPRHIKVRESGGSLLLERCEDDGCRVREEGQADCGRVACASCGCGGGNIVIAEPDAPIVCRCGHSWIPAW
jgi:hypothetical protein